MANSLEQIWSVEIDASAGVEHAIFRQRNHTLEVPTQELSKEMLQTIRSKRMCCGGCIDLPMRGYMKSKKNSWCNFSRGIASLYDAGWRWVPDDPKLQYLVIISTFDLETPTVVESQTFHVVKCTPTRLRTRILAFEEETIAAVDWDQEMYGGICPYRVGYIPEGYTISEDPEYCIRSKHNVYTVPFKDCKIFFISNDNMAYTVETREIKNGKA